MKKRASARARRARGGLPPPPEAPGAGAGPAPLPVSRELSGARGVRAPLETFLAGLAEIVPYQRASFFFLPPDGAGDLLWAANFWRSAPADEPVVGLSAGLVNWAMADTRPKVAPPGTLGADRRVYVFLPLWGLAEPLGLIVVRTLLEAEGLDLAATSAVQGLAGWFGERIAYAVAYLGAEAERSALADREALAAELLDSVAEGLLAVDRSGRVRFINRNARILLRLFDPDYRGRELLPLLPPELTAVMAGLLEETRERGGAPARQAEWRTGETSFPLELSATRVLGARGAAGEGPGGSALVVIRNLAAGARLVRLEEIDRLKSELISTVSHELKSPLSSLREAASLLAEGAAGKLSPAQRQLTDIIGRNADWLMRLIGDLLDMSRLESGRISLDRADLEVDALVTVVAGRFRMEAERKRLDFRLRPGAAGARVSADRDRLEQVLVNLLANAFKFTLRGFVEVATAASGGWVEIAVADSGVGIAREDLPLIFDMFEQVGRRPELSRKGSGLGLAISRKLVELHGGEILVRSQPEQGSTFTVRLPAAAPGAADDGRP